MEAFVGDIVELIRAHPNYAGAIAGLLAFGESLVLVGILLPGTAALLVMGGLVGAGILHPAPVLIGAAFGAILGDTLSYLVGGWLGRGVIRRWPLNQQREGVARSRLFFRRYGLAAVFFGRFFGPVRSLVPFVAGTIGMDWRRFQFANISSALIWVPVVLSPGWLAAKSAGGLIEAGEADYLGFTIVVLGAATLLAIAGVRMLRRSKPRRGSATNRQRTLATLDRNGQSAK